MKPILSSILTLTLFAPYQLFSQRGKIAKDTTIYIATLETSRLNVENDLFYNLESSTYPRAGIAGYPEEDNKTIPNEFLARVNGSINNIGPAIILKMDSGDIVDIAVQSFYKTNAIPKENSQRILPDLASSLYTGLTHLASPMKSVSLLAGAQPDKAMLISGLKQFTDIDNGSTGNKPKSSLNWILLDDQFHFISSYPQSGAIPVKEPQKINILGYKGIPITKAGYLYVYLSNESPDLDVYFDNLTIVHYHAPARITPLVVSNIITETSINITTESSQNIVTEN